MSRRAASTSHRRSGNSNGRWRAITSLSLAQGHRSQPTPATFARGRVSSSAPTRIAAANPPTSTRVGYLRSRCRQKPTVPHFEHEQWSTVLTGQKAVHVSQDQAIRSRCEPQKSIGNANGLFYRPHAPQCPHSCLPTRLALLHLGTRLAYDTPSIS